MKRKNKKLGCGNTVQIIGAYVLEFGGKTKNKLTCRGCSDCG